MLGNQKTRVLIANDDGIKSGYMLAMFLHPMRSRAGFPMPLRFVRLYLSKKWMWTPLWKPIPCRGPLPIA